MKNLQVSERYNKKIIMNTFTLFTDGSAQPNPGPCGAGAVMLDSDENVVWTLSEYLGDGTNNIGELTAILRGVMRSLEMGASHVKVYSDSELSVALLRGEKHTKKEHLSYIVTRIHNVLAKRKDVKVEFEWIKAHNNHKWNDMADSLATKAITSICTNETSVCSSPSRLDIHCSFAEKDNVKKLGARWDPERKIWWTSDTQENRAKFAQWLEKK